MPCDFVKVPINAMCVVKVSIEKVRTGEARGVTLTLALQAVKSTTRWVWYEGSPVCSRQTTCTALVAACT